MISLTKVYPAEYIAKEVDSIFDIGHQFRFVTGFKNTNEALADNKLAMLSHYYKMVIHLQGQF